MAIQLIKGAPTSHHSRADLMKLFKRARDDILISDHSYESIAALGDGFHKSGLIRPITQCLPNLQDVFIDQLRIDICSRPEGIEQFVASHEATGMLNQISKDIKGLRRKRDGGLRIPETLVSGVKPEL